MKLTIFGATGGTGKHVVDKALTAGHHVTAFVRNPDKLKVQHENLTCVKGDALNPDEVSQAIAGADAVISILAQSKNSPKDLQTRATENIVAAMQKHGVKRLVSTTGGGMRVPEDNPGLMDNVIRFLLQTLSGDVLKDAENHYAVIKQSDLEWVVPRGPMLHDNPGSDDYIVGYVGDTGARLSRESFADFTLKAATSNEWVGKAPMLSDK